MDVPAQRSPSSTLLLRQTAEPAPAARRASDTPATTRLAGARTLVAPHAERLVTRAERAVPTVMTVSLALLFLWFGALKIAGQSPVVGLVSATLPWFDPDVLLPALGVVEVVLAVGLVVRRLRTLLLVALAGHLTGTFLSFAMAPDLMFQDANVLLLTADGEFVLKNLVLVSAALLMAGHARSTGGSQVRTA